MDRRARFLVFALALALGALFFCRAQRRAVEGGATPADLARLDARRHAVWDSGRFDERGFVRAKPPVLGEWLYRFPENGQTLDEYLHDPTVNRRAPGRETIYLRPLAPVSSRTRAVLEPVRRFTEAFFQLETKLLPERALPESARVRGRNGELDQFDADRVATDLERDRPSDALIGAGIASEDLFSGSLNFVFGIGRFTERTGVYSFLRFEEGSGREERIYRRRAFQLVAHELGHMFSLRHCIFYECEQAGSLSLYESDRAPAHACPVCLAKLESNVGFDRAKRYRDLARVYRENGLEDEARFCEERLR